MPRASPFNVRPAPTPTSAVTPLAVRIQARSLGGSAARSGRSFGFGSGPKRLHVGVLERQRKELLEREVQRAAARDGGSRGAELRHLERSVRRDDVFAEVIVTAHEERALVRNPKAQRLPRRRMRVEQAITARRLDVEMSPSLRAERQGRAFPLPAEDGPAEVAAGRSQQKIWPESRIFDGFVAPRQKRAELGVADPRIDIRVGRTAQRRAELVAQDPALIAFPLVTVAVRRRREDEARVREARRNRRGERAGVRLAPPARTTIEDHEVGLTRVDDHVVLRGGRAREQVEQHAARETPILEHEEALAAVNVAVPAVEKEETRSWLRAPRPFASRRRATRALVPRNPRARAHEA